MTENELPATSTPLDAELTRAALLTQWRAQLGGHPERKQWLVVLAQIWHETGAGRSCWNYSLAGVKHMPGDGRDYAMLRTTELVGGVYVPTRAAFRAFADLDAGMADYFQILRTTFAAAWPAITAGDVAAFAHALKLAHYYTALETDYAAALARHYRDLDGELLADTLNESPSKILFVLPE
jgi:flagellum-specific peptidoglycan hydrolase FlgJ